WLSTFFKGVAAGLTDEVTLSTHACRQPQAEEQKRREPGRKIEPQSQHGKLVERARRREDQLPEPDAREAFRMPFHIHQPVELREEKGGAADRKDCHQEEAEREALLLA